MHPRIPLAFLATRAHCWLLVNLLSTRTPRSLSTELFSNRSALSLYWCNGLFLPRWRNTCPCWTSSSSSLPNSPACPGITEWQHSLLVYPPLLPVLCHQQTWWMYTLTLHPDHWWRSWPRLGQVLTPSYRPPTRFSTADGNPQSFAISFIHFIYRTIMILIFGIYFHLFAHGKKLRSLNWKKEESKFTNS